MALAATDLTIGERYFRLLNLLQIELIRRYRAGERSAREPLLATVAGIAAGVRTTG